MPTTPSLLVVPARASCHACVSFLQRLSTQWCGVGHRGLQLLSHQRKVVLGAVVVTIHCSCRIRSSTEAVLVVSHEFQVCNKPKKCVTQCGWPRMQPCAPPAQEYDGKKLVCVTKEGLTFDDSEEEKKRIEEIRAAYEPLTRLIKDILGDKVEKVCSLMPLLSPRTHVALPEARCCSGWLASMRQSVLLLARKHDMRILCMTPDMCFAAASGSCTCASGSSSIWTAAGRGGRAGGGLAVRTGHGRVRLERQHGAHHEGAGAA